MGTLPLAAMVGRAPQGLWDARPVTMATASSWEARGGGGAAPPPCRCCPGRRGLLGRLPTHRALSLDPPLYKSGTIPEALTERETMRRTGGTGEGGHRQCPSHACPAGQRGLSWARWNGVPPSSSSWGLGWGRGILLTVSPARALLETLFPHPPGWWPLDTRRALQVSLALLPQLSPESPPPGHPALAQRGTPVPVPEEPRGLWRQRTGCAPLLLAPSWGRHP